MPNLEEMFQHLLQVACEATGANQGSVMIQDSRTSELIVQAVHFPRRQPGEGISGYVFQSGMPLLVEDIDSDARLSGHRRSLYSTKSLICVPLKVQDTCVGVINLTGKEPGPFTEEDLRFLEVLTGIMGMAMDRSDFIKEMEKLRKMSITDPLTSLRNRRYFQEELLEEIERSRRFGFPLSLIMLDLDDFKFYNDTFGHPEGDEALKRTADSINANVRVIDVVCRYGGEEFAVILPQTAIDSATIVAERTRREIERAPFRRTQRKSLTASMGIASFPRDANDMEDLIRLADQALYVAKAEGKNRVVAHDPSAVGIQDRRRSRRLPIRLSTLVTGKDDWGSFEEETYLDNLSAGGAAFPLSRRLRITDLIGLHITPPYRLDNGHGERVLMQSHVLRESNQEGRYTLAVQFLEPCPLIH